jgi:hypothetical protein
MTTKTGFTVLATVTSDSDLSKHYNVGLKDGQLACSCLGWTRHVPRKDCRHILYFKMGGSVGVKHSVTGAQFITDRTASRAA